jgi:eukaryotic-like serine/threonine-protein kinase
VFIAWQAAEGLSYVHNKAGPDGVPMAIVHRDVSPQNVMISYEGEVKVIDFGIARSTARSHSTQSAMVMGKLGYMAPEQALAEPVDARADQYALAVLLWELLAGRHYVGAGTTPEIMVAMAQPKRQPLPPLRSEVSPELDAIVQKALSRSSSDRYPTTDDFSRALHTELNRLGQPTRKQIGDWVKLKCSEAYETNQRLLSKLSTLSRQPTAAAAPATESVKTVETRGTPMNENPASTDAVLAAARPSRMPVVAAALVGVALLGGGLWFLKGDGPAAVPPPPQENPSKIEEPKLPVVPPVVVEAAVPDAGTAAQAAPVVDVKKSAPLFADGDKTLVRAGSDDGLKVGIELKIVGAPNKDGKHPLLGTATVLEVFPKMARLSLDDAAARAAGEKSAALSEAAAAVVDTKKPAPGVKVALNALLNLVQDPVRAVRLKNTGAFAFTRCTVLIPGQRQVEFASLPAGMAREITLDKFGQNPSAAVLDNEVRLTCAQGSITLPAQ